MAVEVEETLLPPFDPECFRTGKWDESPDVIEFARLMEESDNLPEGEVVGFMLQWQVADGYAWYRVVSEDPLEVSHVPYSDGWRVDPIMIKGLDLDDVHEKIRQRKAFWSIFGGGS